MTLVYRSPEAEGIPSAAIRRLSQRWRDEGIAVHSFMLARHGHVIACGEYGPWRLDERHQLFSLSKTFTATAIGFLVAEGRLAVTDRLLDHFGDRLPREACAGMREMTVRHLLTMNTGHDASVNEVFGGGPDDSWVDRFLRSYVPHQGGRHFLYNTPATYMLSALVQKITGETLGDYLRPRLIEPLGIDAGNWWEMSPEGIATGGFGYNLSCRDIMRFGLFLLRRGEVNGRQLLPAAWFDEASRAWSDNASHEPGEKPHDWNQGYGYQIWRCQPDGVYRGDGAFGQFCVIMPEQDMVFTATSGTDNLQGILSAVWEELLPVVGTADTAGATAAAGGEPLQLQEELAVNCETAAGIEAGVLTDFLLQTGGRRYRTSCNALDLLNIIDFELLPAEAAATAGGQDPLSLEAAPDFLLRIGLDTGDRDVPDTGDWLIPACRTGWLRWTQSEARAIQLNRAAPKRDRHDLRPAVLQNYASRASLRPGAVPGSFELLLDVAVLSTPAILRFSFTITENWLDCGLALTPAFDQRRQDLTAAVR